ncbi:MAG: hypothetical protein JRF35_08035 [Deltaproteobacteria bacterium]|nr:hypothetical protein [Deltaproteobacteria bacterium]
MEFTIKTKEETYRIEASVKEIGEDLLVAIWGGDRPHIGAVAIAQPRPSLKDRTEISATASVFCYVGHKDDVVAKEAAERISSALNTNVVVAAGIHWDDIDEAGINAIIENSRHLVEMIIERVPMREPR